MAAESIVAVLALGPALVAIATLALIALLAARRRRSTLAVARSRGASAWQVLLPALVEGALVAVPSALLAAAVAVVALPSGRLALTLGAASLVGLAVMVIVAVTVVPVARAQGQVRRSGDRTVTPVGGRRLVAELFVVGLAIGGAVLLRDRGAQAAGVGGAIAGFDPLIAAVPALVGLAAGLVAVRMYPPVMRVAAWLARRRRGLVPMLAARRATEGGASAAVLLVLLATATVGTFAVAALDHLDRGADVAAWQATGAAYRIEPVAGALPPAFDPTAIPGAEAVATVFQASVPLDMTGPQVMVTIPAAGQLAAALAGTPIDPAFPPGFSTPGDGPIPAIVSQSLIDSPRGVHADSTFVLSVEGYALTYRVVGIRAAYPGIPAGRHFVIAARETFKAAAPKARILPVVALVRAPATQATAIRAAVAAMSPALVVSSEAEDAAARRAAPITAAVRALVLLGALVTALYAALGVAAALALAGLARTQEVATLRTLGLSSRQSAALVVAEHGPATMAAFVAGAALGIGLFLLLRTSLGLARLTGALVDVPVVLEAGPVLLILAAMVSVVAIGLLLGAALQRRVAPSTAIRGRFE
jgi:putative ABC transport system permease protein